MQGNFLYRPTTALLHPFVCEVPATSIKPDPLLKCKWRPQEGWGVPGLEAVARVPYRDPWFTFHFFFWRWSGFDLFSIFLMFIDLLVGFLMI